MSTTTTNGTIDALLSRLDGVRQAGKDQWQARCPAHEDQRASLSIGVRDGKVLVHCHAGCETEAVVAAVGLTMKDLQPSDNGNGRAAAPVTAYDYRDADGVLVFQVVRFPNKQFRQRRPQEGGGWVWKLDGVERIPYRLPVLLAADPAQTVFIVEGEEDANRLAAAGLVATCNAGGAGKWIASYNEHLRGRRVVILPDNDDPGRKHGQQVAQHLQGVAASVKVTELPGLPSKGDVSDWLDAGHTVDELTALVAATGEWQRSHEAPNSDADNRRVTLTEPAATSTPEHRLPHTDSGLAERFARLHGENVRYCHPWQKWLAWDGQRWKMDDTGEVERLAKLTARSILREAADCDNDDIRKALSKFARQAESAASRAAMLRLARSEPPIPILPQTLDSDPWALNCDNGTLDLHTGALRPHRKEDLITKLAPVAHDPHAACAFWLAFLDRIFDRRAPLIDFIQRLMGYCLTGLTIEQILAIFYGVGANGKSTLVDVLLAMLGTDYAMQAGPDLLMVRRGEQHPTALADLHGKRVVVCCESEEGARLAESLVKQLTGGDRIRARRMREDHWEFSPTHKVLLVTNHKPEIRGTDYAVWRRIRLIPFDAIIPPPQQDKRLPEKLRAELPGVLAWAVRGCLAWQQHGLGEPAEVAGATETYRSEQDLLGGFLHDCCVVDSGCRAKASVLFEAYRQWSGDRKAVQRRFGVALRERGFRKYTSNGVWWEGVGLLEGGGTEGTE